MSCIIRSRIKIVNPCIWKRINVIEQIKQLNSKINEFTKYTLTDLIDKFNFAIDEHIVKANLGAGFFVQINNTPYVITCNHVVGLKPFEIHAIANPNNQSTQSAQSFQSVELSVVKTIPEFDIAILKFVDEC